MPARHPEATSWFDTPMPHWAETSVRWLQTHHHVIVASHIGSFPEILLRALYRCKEYKALYPEFHSQSDYREFCRGEIDSWSEAKHRQLVEAFAKFAAVEFIKERNPHKVADVKATPARAPVIREPLTSEQELAEILESYSPNPKVNSW